MQNVLILVYISVTNLLMYDTVFSFYLFIIIANQLQEVIISINPLDEHA